MRYLAIVILLLASPAAAEVHVVDRVADGDMIVIKGVHVRLLGIDAPEGIGRDGREAPGAREATAHLRILIGSERVDCELVDYDAQQNRPVMNCSVKGRNLSLAQLSAGHAAVWCSQLRRKRPLLLTQFKQAEAGARANKRGIWANPVTPWRDWGC